MGEQRASLAAQVAFLRIYKDVSGTGGWTHESVEERKPADPLTSRY